MKRKDVWILLAILALALLCYVFFGRTASTAQQGTPLLRITASGRETRLVTLDHSKELVIEGENDARNVVSIFPGGFSMAESNCRHQDCIRQGTVTTENAGSRPLGGRIICLPHKLVLELVFENEETTRLEVTP